MGMRGTGDRHLVFRLLLLLDHDLHVSRILVRQNSLPPMEHRLMHNHGVLWNLVLCQDLQHDVGICDLLLIWTVVLVALTADGKDQGERRVVHQWDGLEPWEAVAATPGAHFPGNGRRLHPWVGTLREAVANQVPVELLDDAALAYADRFRDHWHQRSSMDLVDLIPIPICWNQRRRQQIHLQVPKCIPNPVGGHEVGRRGR
mmetsp:Transcript_54681/g.102492  ORF Transcript_54681/g.102492 Transcript_54681/m.102492 type:complete len:202 (+) Transcript_54681:171-776(+)